MSQQEKKIRRKHQIFNACVWAFIMLVSAFHLHDKVESNTSFTLTILYIAGAVTISNLLKKIPYQAGGSTATSCK